MADTYAIVRQFERDLCDYTGARYAVTVTSCTMALLLAVAYHLRNARACRNCGITAEQIERAGRHLCAREQCDGHNLRRRTVEIPKRTYVSVPMSIIHAGGRPTFRDEDWLGTYQLKPLPVWDSARLFTSGMYRPGTMDCVSFHWGKTLGIQQGGAILHDDPEADEWLRRARFDGRKEGVAPKDDDFQMIGWHAYMSPETAAQGVMRLALLPKHNKPLPNDPYPDLAELPIFKGG